METAIRTARLFPSLLLLSLLAWLAPEVSAITISLSNSPTCLGNSGDTITITVTVTPVCENDFAPSVTCPDFTVTSNSYSAGTWIGSIPRTTAGTFTITATSGCDAEDTAQAVAVVVEVASVNVLSAARVSTAGTTEDWVACRAVCGTTDVSATPNPTLSETELPECWTTTGGDVGTEKLTRSIDLINAHTGEVTFTAGASSITVFVRVLEVSTITVSAGTKISDDGGTETWVASKTTSGTVTVTATANPGLTEDEAKTEGICWTTTGGNGSDILTRTANRSAAGTTPITFEAGVSSKTVVVKVFQAEVKAVTFTSDHAVLTDYNGTYEGTGGTAYSPRGWQKSPFINNPITHTLDTKLQATVTLLVEPAGVPFRLTSEGLDSAESADHFTYNIVSDVSSGADLELDVESTGNLPAGIDKIDAGRTEWKVRVGEGTDEQVFDAGISDDHVIYLFFDQPATSAGEATLKRILGAVNEAKGAAYQAQAHVKIRKMLNAKLSFDNSLGEDSAWKPMDTGTWDCLSLARCHVVVAGALGASAVAQTAYPSDDADYETEEPSRVCANPVHGVEVFRVLDKGIPNVFEGCVVADGIWYPFFGSVSEDDEDAAFVDARTVILFWLTLDPNNKQVWWKAVGAGGACETPGPYPVIPP